MSFRTKLAYNKAAPPPTTIPSSIAHLVAIIASFSLSLISFTSNSVAPPTLITPTPPYNLALLSESFSISYSEVDDSISPLIYSTLDLIEVFSPAPSIITVSSFPIIIFLQDPKISIPACSNSIPSSGSRTSPAVRIAISSS